jgi:hypothetical protein
VKGIEIVNGIYAGGRAEHGTRPGRRGGGKGDCSSMLLRLITATFQGTKVNNKRLHQTLGRPAKRLRLFTRGEKYESGSTKDAKVFHSVGRPGFGTGVGRHGSHPEVQEQTAARGGSLAVKLNAHVAPVVAGHTRH